jgi:hypothetical protein
MKVTINQEFIRRRATVARWSSLIGLGVLFVGLIVSFNQQYYYWSLPALVAGFFLANISAFNANRYVKAAPGSGFSQGAAWLSAVPFVHFQCTCPPCVVDPVASVRAVGKAQDGVIRRRREALAA